MALSYLYQRNIEKYSKELRTFSNSEKKSYFFCFYQNSKTAIMVCQQDDVFKINIHTAVLICLKALRDKNDIIIILCS